jgi:hypothetical protein
MRVLIPLPDRDFDVTEVAVPWQILRAAGHQVVFATERAGTVPAADPRLLTGVLFGQLGAAPAARAAYAELAGASEFTATLGWADLDVTGFDGAARSRSPRGAPRTTTRRPSRSPTAATCPPAGPVTPTSSAASSAISCPVRPHPPAGRESGHAESFPPARSGLSAPVFPAGTTGAALIGRRAGGPTR